jgi:hypothetical protein
MAITRYDPFRDLFRLQDQLFKTFGEAYELTVRGERKLEKAEEREGYRRIERTYGAFSRSFTLPSTVDAEHISAESRDGVLRIVLPKRAETKPRQIKVQVEAARPSQGAAPAKQ